MKTWGGTCPRCPPGSYAYVPAAKFVSKRLYRNNLYRNNLYRNNRDVRRGARMLARRAAR